MQPSPCAVRTGRAWCHLAFVISIVLDVHTFASSASVSLFLPLFKSHSIANQGHMRSVSKVFFFYTSAIHTQGVVLCTLFRVLHVAATCIFFLAIELIAHGGRGRKKKRKGRGNYNNLHPSNQSETRGSPLSICARVRSCSARFKPATQFEVYRQNLMV